jgi:hypothetical protein
MRRDGVGNDVTGRDIRQRPFQSPPDLDAHAVVVLGHQENGAIVDALASQFPSVINPNAVLLDVFRLRGGDDQHHDLAALLGLEGRELGLQSIDGLAGQGAGQIGDSRCRRRHRDLGTRGQRGQSQQKC